MEYKDVRCAVCGKNDYRILYPEKIGSADLDDRRLFSAKRMPARLHFRIVKCRVCGLVYSNPVYPEEKISELYKRCEFIDDGITRKQSLNVMSDYSKHLKKAAAYSGGKERLLDIGCGNGQFLKIAKEAGFKRVYGVEPGIDAVMKADPDIRPRVINGFFRDGLFDDNYFDMVCSFHTLDHVIDPNGFLAGIHKILKHDGILLLITHNVKSLLTRLAGENAPMIHVEHVYLFDRGTIKSILNRNGFDIIRNENVACAFTLAHTIKTIPLPLPLKTGLLKILAGKRIADMRIRLMPGDMLTIAGKRIEKVCR